MIRVCHLTASFYLPHGPSGGILAQVDHQRSDVRSSVWSMYAPPPELDASAALASRGIPFRVFGMARSFLDLAVLPRLVAALRREKPDVLHCHLLRANLYGRIAARLAGVPVVISTWRNVEPYMSAPGVVSRLVRAFESHTARLVDAVVAVSERVRTDGMELLHLPPEKVVTVLNAIELEPFRAPLPRPSRNGHVVIGTLGLLEPRKNHAWLIDALTRIAGVRLVIAGDGPERENLLARAKSLGVADRVSLPGLERDVRSFLGGIDIFVLTSVTEGLPRALMEAMAAGLPVVTTDAGGAAEAFEHAVSGFVVPVGDMDGFVAEVGRLARDPELRRSVGAAARVRAFELFDPKRMADEYTRLYENLRARSRR